MHAATDHGEGLARRDIAAGVPMSHTVVPPDPGWVPSLGNRE